jgi:hypothetical protein
MADRLNILKKFLLFSYYMNQIPIPQKQNWPCRNIYTPKTNLLRAYLFNMAQCFKLLLKLYFMRSILYLFAVILIIGWLIGVFAYSVGGLIHILLVLAIISLLLGVIRRSGD